MEILRLSQMPKDRSAKFVASYSKKLDAVIAANRGGHFDKRH